MSSRLPVELANRFGSAAPVPGPRTLPRAARFLPGVLAEDDALPGEAGSARRTRIWELAASLHCSIVGTCLSAGELRQLLVRLNAPGAATTSDHDLHQRGVLIAGLREAGAKFLQKALDRRHRVAISQFAKAKGPDALRALWAEAVGRGEIPGAYWAVLTHPAATEALVKQAFGEVHMLSHLVGAANRADIRRLRQLEEDNAALAAKVERQQRQLRDGFTARDATIRRLNDMLVRQMAQPAEPSTPDRGAGAASVTSAAAEMHRRLAGETARREGLERRLDAIAKALHEAQQERRRADGERDGLRAELATLETRIGMLFQAGPAAPARDLDHAGITVLYVGGRAHQAPQLKAVVERTGARFLHHDGGIEHAVALLPGLVSRADLAVFPVDCVSHDAVACVKRLCRQSAKRYVPMRTASLTSLISALSSAARPE